MSELARTEPHWSELGDAPESPEPELCGDCLTELGEPCAEWCVGHAMFGFECVLCGEFCSPDMGASDAVERLLGDDERGVCDDCFAELPDHVIDWAEGYEGRES